MKQSGGSVLSIGKKVSMEKPSIPVFAKVNTPVDRPQGSFTEVQISIGASVPALIVSETALLEDYGKYSVIVQVSGETYEKRPIMVGRRNGASVEVTRGLKKGEIVVTKGVYQVKMASLSSSVPAHGHQH
jgi:multidrug efflux pump subunit AcrA (membrane-fusion protein)